MPGFRFTITRGACGAYGKNKNKKSQAFLRSQSRVWVKRKHLSRQHNSSVKYLRSFHSDFDQTKYSACPRQHPHENTQSRLHKLFWIARNAEKILHRFAALSNRERDIQRWHWPAEMDDRGPLPRDTECMVHVVKGTKRQAKHAEAGAKSRRFSQVWLKLWGRLCSPTAWKHPSFSFSSTDKLKVNTAYLYTGGKYITPVVSVETDDIICHFSLTEPAAPTWVKPINEMLNFSSFKSKMFYAVRHSVYTS